MNYSSSAAGRRIAVARCIRRFPAVLELLHRRELNLSTAALIASVLTEANVQDILPRVRGKSSRAVERVVSEYRPPVALRDRVRPVRVPAQKSADLDRVLFERELNRIAPDAAWPGTPGVGSEQKLFVQFLASEELMRMFEQAQALLSRRCIDSSFADVLGIILKEFIERHSPEARHQRREERQARKAVSEPGQPQEVPATTEPPEPGGPRVAPAGRVDHAEDTAAANHSRRREWNTNSLRDRGRHIPDDVRDAVYVRGGGQCTFVARDGTRCGSKHALQVDHIRPFAAGGTHDPDNLRLLCAAHNRLAAEQTLGKHVMRPFWRRE